MVLLGKEQETIGISPQERQVATFAPTEIEAKTGFVPALKIEWRSDGIAKRRPWIHIPS